MKMMGVCAEFLYWRIRLGRLEAVDVRHVDVEQDDRELRLQDVLQRLLPGTGADDVLVQVVQDGAGRR